MKLTWGAMMSAANGEWMETSLTVEREEGDARKFYGGERGSGESQFFGHLRRALIAAGIPMIRKRMYKDGHMVAEEQHYLRSPRIKRGQPYLMIWNGNYAIEGADTMWNRDGCVLLQVERGIGGDS